MVDINKDNLEKAISDPNKNSEDKESKTQENSQEQQMSKEMEIGFHQGALNTLGNERNELIKMAQNVESIMQAHLQRLEELGVDVGKNKENNSEQKSQ